VPSHTIELDEDTAQRLNYIITRRGFDNSVECIKRLIFEQARFLDCESCPDFDQCNIPIDKIETTCTKCPRCFSNLGEPRSHVTAQCKTCGWK